MKEFLFISWKPAVGILSGTGLLCPLDVMCRIPEPVLVVCCASPEPTVVLACRQELYWIPWIGLVGLFCVLQWWLDGPPPAASAERL